MGKSDIAFAIMSGVAIAGSGTAVAVSATQASKNVINVDINEEGHLILHYSDETDLDVGLVKGSDGAKGDKGDTGEQGPQGEKGDTGEKGAKGDKGDSGEKGAKGDKGDTGAKGEKGDAGNDGADGEDGEDGEDGTSFLQGAEDPASTLGNNGDTYLNTVSCDLFYKSNGAWAKVANIKGEQGPQGEGYKEDEKVALIKRLNRILERDHKSHISYQSVMELLNSRDITADDIQENNILWDSYNDVFAYVEDDELIYELDSVGKDDKLELGDYRLWEVVSEPIAYEDQTHSMYWNSLTLFEGDLAVGFDAGVNSLYGTLNYLGEEGKTKEVTINTNGSKLVINSTNDTINSFGKVSTLEIDGGAENTLVENGKVDYAIAKDGVLKLNSTAAINVLMIETQNIGTTDERNDVPYDFTIGKEDGAKINILKRGSITISDKSRFLNVINEDKVEGVYFTKQGIVDDYFTQFVTSVDGKNFVDGKNASEIAKEFASLLGNKTNWNYEPTGAEIEAGELTVAPISDHYTKTGLDEAQNSYYESFAEVLNTFDVYTEETVPDDSWYEEEAEVMEVSGGSQVAALVEMVEEGETFEGKTIKLEEDLYLNGAAGLSDINADFEAIGTGSEGQCENPFKGTFDCNGNAIKYLTQYCYQDHDGAPYGIFGYAKDATFKNIVIDGATIYTEYGNVNAGNGVGTICGVASGECLFENITVRNCDLCGYILNIGAVCGAVVEGDVTFKNIRVEDTVKMHTWYGSPDTQIGGIVGVIDIQPGAKHGLASSHVTFEDCYIACEMQDWTRSVGMLCGGFTVDNSDTIWNNCSAVAREQMEEAITCINVEVHYGTWNQWGFDMLVGNRDSGGDDRGFRLVDGVSKTYAEGAYKWEPAK